MNEEEALECLAQQNRDLERQVARLAGANEQLGLANEWLKQANLQLEQEFDRRKEAETGRQQAEKALEDIDEKLSLLSAQEASRWKIDALIGRSRAVARILEDVRRLQGTGRTSVLITGESGTGKELVARAIHFGGTRSQELFVPVNCSAIPGELAESSFFGHERGAFTGAVEPRKGYFELADGGTLFLDEIGDMPLGLQAKLLRALETGCVMPVGGAEEIQVDVRILAATNQDLLALIAGGRFREDLYFRLTGFTVTVPPLRERVRDIPLLAEHFLTLFATEMGREPTVLSPEALERMESYGFPGNVRELKNVIEHALIKSDDAVIRPEHLPFIRRRTDTWQHGRPSTMAPPRFEVQVNGSAPGEETATGETALPEEKILAYVKERDSINNAECRQLLSIDLQQASYLLKKLHENGLLERRGERRWSRYYLPVSHPNVTQ